MPFADSDSAAVADTLFATIAAVPPRTLQDLKRVFDSERATIVLQELFGRWSPPRPFDLPSTLATPLPGKQGTWVRRAAKADVGFLTLSTGRIATVWVTDSGQGPSLTRSVLAAIAATDTASVLPPYADTSTRVGYRVVVGLVREEGVSMPLMVVRQQAHAMETGVLSKSVAPTPVAGAPKYPSGLRSAGIGGEVQASFEVDTLGSVVNGSVRILSATNQEFADAVIAHLGTARFIPAMLGGCKVQQRTRMPFSFGVR